MLEPAREHFCVLRLRAMAVWLNTVYGWIPEQEPSIVQ